jgi:hypothetical protein
VILFNHSQGHYALVSAVLVWLACDHHHVRLYSIRVVTLYTFVKSKSLVQFKG